MSDTNNAIITRALKRIFTLVPVVLAVVLGLLNIFTKWIHEKDLPVAILGAVILFLVGIIISMYFESKKITGLSEPQKSKSQPHPKGEIHEDLSYVDIEYASAELIKDIRSFRPDIIIGVDRGGAIVGGILAKCLEKPMATISSSEQWTISSPKVSLDDAVLNPEKRAERYRTIKKVLLVDDVCRMGTTMKTAYDTLKEVPGFELKTATILNVKKPIGPAKPIEPDFSVYVTKRSDVKMPWDL